MRFGFNHKIFYDLSIIKAGIDQDPSSFEESMRSNEPHPSQQAMDEEM